VNTFRRAVRRRGFLAVGIPLALIAVACTAPSRSGSRGSAQPASDGSAGPAIEVSPVDSASPSDDPCSEMFSNLFVGVDSISYNGYEVVRLEKTVHDKEQGGDIPVTYAVLKSGGRTIATFEGGYFGLGNQTNFGFASLLGGETKQLVVSQTVPRGGRQWIVDLSSEAATVFDSKEWSLGLEDVCIHDYDGDGVEEISLAITSFWGIGHMSMAESPLPGVVFKYDSRARAYMPDKAAFVEELSDIDSDVEKIDANEDPRQGSNGPYLATRLDIFLRYAYGGRENDGWSFFDRTYNLADKQDVKREIKRILNSEPVYRFVYGIQPVNRRSL
jgi:hypothetical protein